MTGVRQLSYMIVNVKPIAMEKRRAHVQTNTASLEADDENLGFTRRSLESCHRLVALLDIH